MFWHMPTAAASGALDRRFAALPRPYFARARARIRRPSCRCREPVHPWRPNLHNSFSQQLPAP